MTYKIQILFRVFDREQAPVEYEEDFIPMVYILKRRVKRMVGMAGNKGMDGTRICTIIWKEMSIDNGKGMILYKWVSTKWQNHKLQLRIRKVRIEEQYIRTKQVL